MPATYEPIATTTLGANAASVTFSSISSAYTDLRLIVVGTSTGTEELHIRLNGQTGTIYSWIALSDNGSAVVGNQATNQESMRISGTNFRATQPCMAVADIFSYTGSTWKTVMSRGTSDYNTTGGSGVGLNFGLWRNTAAITSVTVGMRFGSADQMVTGTTITLFGILKAQETQMANTYTLIAAQTLSSTAASVTFSSIPATYDDLVLRTSIRTASAGLSTEITFNGVAGNSYSNTAIYVTGGSPTRVDSTNRANILAYFMDNPTNTVNTFSSSEIYIPGYRVARNKPVYITANPEDNATSTYSTSHEAGLWRNTAAITSITLTGGGGSYATGSTFYLYGIKNS